MDEAERYADSIAIIDRGEIIDIGQLKNLWREPKQEH